MFALVGMNTKLVNGNMESLWYPALLVVLAENVLKIIQIIVGRLSGGNQYGVQHYW